MAQFETFFFLLKPFCLFFQRGVLWKGRVNETREQTLAAAREHPLETGR